MNENPTIRSNQALLDIHIIQGDTQEVVLAFHDDEGNPIDLTPVTFRMDVKAFQLIDALAIESKTEGNGLLKSANSLTIQFGASTANWKGEEYYYDIIFVDGSKVNRNIRGRIFVTKSVTQ